MTTNSAIKNADDVTKLIRKESERRGYRFVENDNEVKVYRPDGSLAVTARRTGKTSSKR